MSRVISRNSMVLIGLALFVYQISAHGHLSQPTSREYTSTVSDQDFPVSFPLGSDFVCKNKPSLPTSMMTTLTAGQTTTLSWAFAAAHPGDCFAYITYDTNVSDTQQKWFKIAQFRDCNLVNNIPQSVTVPSYLPSCDHCVLRWEWYALHLQPVGSVEFYAQCADVKIIGNNNGVIPSPLVTIPGHIPMDATQYRNPYGDDAATGALIGPPIATPGGALYNCTAQYGSSCITAPTPRGECSVSAQRCVTASTYQACGIGISAPQWYSPQSCQTGLVCVAVAGDRINCVLPSSVPTPVGSSSSSSTSAPYYTPIPPSNPVPSTTAAPKIMTTAASRPSTTASNMPSYPSTTGSSMPAAPSTTASIISNPVPVNPSQGPVNPPVVQPTTCTQGYMKCLTSESYSTCDRGAWGVSQSCRHGLTCSPSGNYIYCV